MFNISRDTIDRWLKRRNSTGSVKAASGYQRGQSSHQGLGRVSRLRQLHGDKTQSEMVQLWQGELSERTISRAGAHRMDSKKKTYGYRERDEDKRTAFVAQLVTIAPSQRVYVDESGMDERDDYGYGV